MRQVRWVLYTLILGALLSVAPLGSAQTLTYSTIDPAGLGNVWAPGIASSAASCSGQNQTGQHGFQGKQQGSHNDEAECDDSGSPPPASAGIQVVGYYNVTPTTPAQSYLWNGTTSTRIVVPGAQATYASGINGAGHIVGYYTDMPPAFGTHGFLMVGAGITKIDVPNAIATFATGVNATDQVVGYYYDMHGPHGFLYSGGKSTTIDFVGSGVWGSYAAGINSSGQIVGYALAYDLTNGWHWLAWAQTGTTITQISITGAAEAKAYGINTAGEMVGEFRDAAGWHGWRLLAGRLTVVDIPGASYTAINGINDSGAISGEYKGIVNPRQLGFKMP